jgi:hypothetical protein
MHRIITLSFSTCLNINPPLTVKKRKFQYDLQIGQVKIRPQILLMQLLCQKNQWKVSHKQDRPGGKIGQERNIDPE